MKDKIDSPNAWLVNWLIGWSCPDKNTEELIFFIIFLAGWLNVAWMATLVLKWFSLSE